ncbi:tricorn protease domain 2-containing protein [Ramaria rubella]|nr:tricorn protease domain 2-containing protein [Ramaria rubella]
MSASNYPLDPSPNRLFSIVFAVAFRPHSHHIFTASSLNAYTIWDVDTQKLVVGPWEQTGLLGYSYPAFSSTGSFIAVGDHQGYIKIWSAIDGSLAAGPFYHDDTKPSNGQPYVTSVAYSPSGKSIASASHDGIVKIWNIKTGTTQVAITFNGYAMSVSYSLSGTLLASAFGPMKSTDKSVMTEIVEGGVARYCLDDKYVVIGRSNGELVVQRAGSGIVAYGPYKVSNGQVTRMAVSPNGKYVAVLEGDPMSIKVWDLLTGKEVKLPLEALEPVQPQDLFFSSSFSSDGAFLAYTSIAQYAGVRIYDLLKNGYSM